MNRLIAAWLMLWLTSTAVFAQEFSGLARIDADKSRIVDADAGRVQIDLYLSQGVPYRLFTLDGPPRLVLDFQEVDWTGLTVEKFIDSQRVTRAQFGTYVPGWSRLVAELADPMKVAAADVELDEITGKAQLTVVLAATSQEAFTAESGAPRDQRWDLPAPADVARMPARDSNAPLVVVLDPGHGGIDPGAETETVDEKTLMLVFARELRELLLRSGGFDVVLTRDSDHFVSLEQRIASSHRANADVFLSLHADALAEGQAHGATVHVLSREASDVASAKLAERHDRGELLSGVDLSKADDEVTGILLDLARNETHPRTEMLAQALVDGMTKAGGPMNRRPLRKAAFSVLKAADTPSVLVEIGFLSSPRDFENLQDPEWRMKMAQGIRNGLQNWRDADAALKPLVRQ